MTPPDWQSLLFVPSGVEKHLASAIRLRPDAIILDLEDAVAPAAKETARAAVRHAQTQIKSARIGCVVRVYAGLRAMLTDIAAMPACAGLMIGSEDYAANLSVDPNGGALVHVAMQLGIAACRRGLLTVGFPGPIANFRNLDLYARQIAQGRALETRVVAAIHPAQLPVIAAAYAVTEAELGWAYRVMAKAQKI